MDSDGATPNGLGIGTNMKQLAREYHKQARRGVLSGAPDIAKQHLMSTCGCLSFEPIEKILFFCDLSVREKDWCSRARGASRSETHAAS